MSCITQLLELKGDKEILEYHEGAAIEGGGCYKGFEYLITFVSHGHRCGYVAVGDGAGIDSDLLRVHGGITFHDADHSAKDLLPAACSDIWLGFDAAHCNDKPDYDLALKYFKNQEKYDVLMEVHKNIENCIMSHGGHYIHRTYDYMEQECKNMIDQIIEQRSAA